MSALLKKQDDDSQTADGFELTGDAGEQPFELEPVIPDGSERAGEAPRQTEFFLPEQNPEQPEATPQIEFEGMPRPVFGVTLHDGRQVAFQNAATLLESLEAQNIEVHYQCREGYCGSCRAQLLEGSVHYHEEPMAWLNDDEILPCCCIPKSDIKIKL
ncbi:MAG: 2Fe-2S ferredoxin-like protein [Pseudomonadota bacterium]|nr:2Fe-2S ferredoxin-like protein [Pseudomonadota bacterium]